MHTFQHLLQRDRQVLWHPYASFATEQPLFPVVSAQGCRLRLADGRELIDGMASWWCAIHGYNHPVLNEALEAQIHKMSHVMFGGLTHEPAIELAELLVSISPAPLTSVFFSDSGSVSVEVAMKMAIQYWHDRQLPEKQQFLTLRQGYHGDTFGAMSVCDPVTGMHNLFSSSLMQQVFIDAPTAKVDEDCEPSAIAALQQALENGHQKIAAFILEPVVQGAGGMRFYSADFLRHARRLCDEYDVLLILDEIATGFARTGKLFACEHAGITPDIMCVGKALTGGYMSLAATLTTGHIAETISNGNPGVFMHGPTFMANPLACAVSLASVRLLLASDWQKTIQGIEKNLKQALGRCASLEAVAEVRVLGAIGVVECRQAVNMQQLQPALVDQGVWIRPFGKLVYVMPPYIITADEIDKLGNAIFEVLK